MPLSSLVSSDGQVKLPQEVRDELGLKEGDRVAFYTKNGVTVLRPEPENPFLAFVGVLPAFESAEQAKDFWRDLRGYEDDEP